MKHPLVLLCAAASVFARTPPRFEAADVHRSAQSMNRYTLVSGGVLRGTRYDLRKATMLDMIRLAYNVDPPTIRPRNEHLDCAGNHSSSKISHAF